MESNNPVDTSGTQPRFEMSGDFLARVAREEKEAKEISPNLEHVLEILRTCTYDECLQAFAILVEVHGFDYIKKALDEIDAAEAAKC